MFHIWGFLLQTISVAVVAGILLLVKYVFEDKLSPRWQYGVWILLMVRILVPANIHSYIIPRFPAWMETIKEVCEKGLGSAYISRYEPISLKHILPVITQIPQSITDWFFVIYAVGVMISLCWYLFSYMRLRIILYQNADSDNAMEQRVKELCDRYQLKYCKCITVRGISSAFMCGVFCPVLVVPNGIYVDDKVLLHELMHYKYCDTAQNIGWCILRSLHWCNPVIQYAVCRIENDVESLCDQRVLEQLEGEERREYGTILLSMANSKYARIPGTSSISNGGKNISRRITAIVRFKKYPKGMALVSVCIILILFNLTIIGETSAYGEDDYRPTTEAEFKEAMAISRLNRCSTVAGALDTYAKGLMVRNGIYIASASSLSKQQQLEASMLVNSTELGIRDYYLNNGEYGDYLYYCSSYAVINLRKISGIKYSGVLAFEVNDYITSDDPDETDNEDGKGILLIPVNILYEDAWVVEETGKRTMISGSLALLELREDFFPGAKWYYAESEVGSVKITVQSIHEIKNTIYTETIFGTDQQFDYSPKVNTEFDNYKIAKSTEYICNLTDENRPQKNVGIISMELDSVHGKFDENSWFVQDLLKKMDFDSPNFSGSSNAGESCEFRTIDETWDGRLYDGSGHGSSTDGEEIVAEFPPAYAVRIYWDSQVVDELTLKEVME